MRETCKLSQKQNIMKKEKSIFEVEDVSKKIGWEKRKITFFCIKKNFSRLHTSIHFWNRYITIYLNYVKEYHIFYKKKK